MRSEDLIVRLNRNQQKHTIALIVNETSNSISAIAIWLKRHACDPLACRECL